MKMEPGYLYELRHENNKKLLPYLGKCLNFDRRKSQHKYNCNNPNSEQYNCEKYKYIRANGGWDAWYMIEIYYGPEYEQMEKDLLKANFNGYINSEQTGRTIAEWRADNKEKLAEYNAKYREEHKEEKSKYLVDYYQNNRKKIRKYQAEKITCDNCGSIVSRNNIATHKKRQKCMNYSSAPSSELSSASEVG